MTATRHTAPHPVGGSLPGDVPALMHAWVVRPERYGEPRDAYRLEVVATPEIGDDEALVYVMAAGVNYNGVFAAAGQPVDLVALRQRRGEPEAFHIGGSDGAGIVYRVGKDVTSLRPGDQVVIHPGVWDRDCPIARSGRDPVLSPTLQAWGFEANFGAFGQFTRVQAHQCVAKPQHLSWEQAACFMVSASTSYKMLHGYPENAVKPNDVVLVWGGAGGLGSAAIQLARAAGARPVAVVGSADKRARCISLGAIGCVDRSAFDHWGPLPAWDDSEAYGAWLRSARAFGKAIWEALGERRNPNIVFEHPGSDTLPTSLFVCERGGMVVTCGGTSGYNGSFDLRYLWLHQKRIQGSHATDDAIAATVTRMVAEGQLDPCLSATVAWEDLAQAQQSQRSGMVGGWGNVAVRVGVAPAAESSPSSR